MLSIDGSLYLSDLSNSSTYLSEYIYVTYAYQKDQERKKTSDVGITLINQYPNLVPRLKVLIEIPQANAIYH